ncbi:diacylglycerol kinase family protein [Cytobacillus purgationiresistens]|nr:diacylglycerol kinase family protein [Cytobacillus purgationiresistens]
MDWKDKRPNRSRNLFESFFYAFSGIFSAVKKERNLQIHLISALFIIFLGWFLSLTWIEWLFISFAIGGMVALELVNTAIERVVDLATADLHPLAKQAKDIAAGAVFIYAILAIIVGSVIFIPKLSHYFW